MKCPKCDNQYLIFRMSYSLALYSEGLDDEFHKQIPHWCNKCNYKSDNWERR
jgi:hypothetical protein